MGSFIFKWDHPANEVYVTGTFDDWSKSERLEKKGDLFIKDVTLSNADEKIYYKFVVDGSWVTDHTAPTENDASGNHNNVLTPDRITKHQPETVGIMSGVTPTSTTAALAKDVPLEKSTEESGSSGLPGSFPETPAFEKGDFSVTPLPASEGASNPIKLAPGESVPPPSSFTNNTVTSGVHDDPELVELLKKQEEKESGQTFGVSPLPAFPGASNPIKVAPGEKLPEPSSFTNNTVVSGVHDDPELVELLKKQEEKAGEQAFGVSPLPAFPGGHNPIKIAPGEKLPDPSTLTGSTIQSTVRTDPASYEKSDALGGAPVLPPVVTPQVERDQKGTGIFDLSPITKNLIPESSLPMGNTGSEAVDAGPTIQSSGPQSTTAQLAGAVPLESSKVPEIVKESQKAAGFEPEASAIPEEVKEKSVVEKELASKIPVVPSTSEGIAGEGTTKTESTVTAGEAAAAVGGAFAALGGAAVLATSSLVSQIPASITSKLPIGIQESINNINTESDSKLAAAKDTPDIVKESIVESGQAPEAAANEEAVLEKKEVEKELLAEVKKVTSTGESAPKITEDVPKVVESAPKITESTSKITEDLPKVDEPAPKVTPVTPAKKLETPAIIHEPESRDVSPGTIPGSRVQTRTEPIVTTGVQSNTTAAKSGAGVEKPVEKPAEAIKPAEASTPVRTTAGSSKPTESPASASASQKKKNRASAFFSKLKSKLSDHK